MRPQERFFFVLACFPDRWSALVTKALPVSATYTSSFPDLFTNGDLTKLFDSWSNGDLYTMSITVSSTCSDAPIAIGMSGAWFIFEVSNLKFKKLL